MFDLLLCFKTLVTTFLSKATLKKSLFPVQRVAIIVASREAAKSFFFFFFFPLYRNGRKNAGKKREKSGNMKKMCLPGPYRVTRPVDRKLNYF